MEHKLEITVFKENCDICDGSCYVDQSFPCPKCYGAGEITDVAKTLDNLPGKLREEISDFFEDLGLNWKIVEKIYSGKLSVNIP